MTKVDAPQYPTDKRKVVRSFNDDGSANFGQVGIEELSYRARFGATTQSSTENDISIGSKYFVLNDSETKFRVGDDILIICLDDPDCYMWGEIIGSDTTYKPMRLLVYTDDVSDVTCTSSNWELQVVARPKPGIEKDTSTTSIDPTGTGPFTFTVTAGKFFPLGGKLLIKPTADRTIALIGEVDRYSGTSLVVSKNATNAIVSASYTSWSIALLDAPPSSSLRSLTSSSSSSASITTSVGQSFSVILEYGKTFPVGSYVLAVSNSSPSNYVYGVVKQSVAEDITLLTLAYGGSGTFASWSLTALMLPLGANLDNDIDINFGSVFSSGISAAFKRANVSTAAGLRLFPTDFVTYYPTYIDNGDLNTAGRILTLKINDADRTIDLSGALTIPTAPASDKILFYDVSAGKHAYLAPGTNLTITGTTIDAATGGDASTNTSTSVDSEIALFSSTGGKTLKRATTTGILKGTSGVIGAASAGTDYYNPGGTDVAIADGGTGQSTATLGFNALSPVTTRGDIIIRDATNNVRLALGTTKQVLKSDGTDIAWGDIGGLWTSTTTNTTSGSTVDFAVPSTANEVIISFNGVSTGTATRDLRLQVLTAAATPDTTAGDYIGFGTTNSGAPAGFVLSVASLIGTGGSGGAADTMTGAVVMTGVKEFAGAAVPFTASWYSSALAGNRGSMSGYWKNATQLYGIRALISGSGSFDAGSITVSYR